MSMRKKGSRMDRPKDEKEALELSIKKWDPKLILDIPAIDLVLWNTCGLCRYHSVLKILEDEITNTYYKRYLIICKDCILSKTGFGCKNKNSTFHTFGTILTNQKVFTGFSATKEGVNFMPTITFGELLNSATSTSRKSLLELSRQIHDQLVYCRKLV